MLVWIVDTCGKSEEMIEWKKNKKKDHWTNRDKRNEHTTCWFYVYYFMNTTRYNHLIRIFRHGNTVVYKLMQSWNEVSLAHT